MAAKPDARRTSQVGQDVVDRVAAVIAKRTRLCQDRTAPTVQDGLKQHLPHVDPAQIDAALAVLAEAGRVTTQQDAAGNTISAQWVRNVPRPLITRHARDGARAPRATVPGVEEWQL